MRLFNTVVVYDVYCVAESEDAAREATLELLTDPAQLPPSEAVAIEVRRDIEVREAWRQESPLVAGDISDDDFDQLRGKKTIDVYAMLHTKVDIK